LEAFRIYFLPQKKNGFAKPGQVPYTFDIMRKILIAGNWKMNKNAGEAHELASEIAAALGRQHEVDVVICPPFTALESTARAIESSGVKLGAQNMHFERSGAYTGEISAEMLRHLFATYVILGHSERRALFQESDEFINQKVLAALNSRLKPILCVGETLEEREAGKAFEVVEQQIKDGLADVPAELAELVVIAYEPVWAIGTGKTATPEQAQEVHAFIRAQLEPIFGSAQAQRTRILYGGSMKPNNAEELLGQKDIDGGLIGGAALEGRSFLQMVEAAAQIKK
jgi:triosephosphate isomerase (TIM)